MEKKVNIKPNKKPTYTERFEFLMKLIRINRMLRKAKIIPANGQK